MTTLPTPERLAEIRALSAFPSAAVAGDAIRDLLALLDASRVETAKAAASELRMRSALEAVMNDKPLACVYAEKLLRATDTPPAAASSDQEQPQGK